MPPLPLATPARADDGFGTAVSVAWAWVMLLLIGFVVFRSDLAHAVARGNEMSVEKAAFTVVNAATLTGFQSSLAIDEYKLPGNTAFPVALAAAPDRSDVWFTLESSSLLGVLRDGEFAFVRKPSASIEPSTDQVIE